jgi:hypothetical protein
MSTMKVAAAEADCPRLPDVHHVLVRSTLLMGFQNQRLTAGT